MPRRGHGEGSIYRRADGRWVGAVSLEGRKRKYFYGKTRKEVQEQLNKALRDLQQGIRPPSGRQTLGQFIVTWIEEVAKLTVRPNTYASYERLVRVHILPDPIAQKSLAKLLPQDVQLFLNNKTKQGTLSPRSIQYLHAVLRRALEVALRWGLVGRNVAKLADPPPVTRPAIRPLSSEQARALLTAARDDRLYALYVVALATGLREAELLGLRWPDVDLDKGEIRVTQALQLIGGSFHLVEPKTQRSRRTVGLPPIAVSALREHKQRQMRERLAAGSTWQEWGLVFSSSCGTPLWRSNLLRHFKRTVKSAGLPPMRFHDLRHAHASFLASEGIELRTIMEALGHSHIALTADLYTHLLPAWNEATRNALQRVLSSD